MKLYQISRFSCWLICLLVAFIGYAQQVDVSKLYADVQNAPDDTTKVNKYHALFWHYAARHSDSAIYIAETAAQLAKKASFARGYAGHIRNIGHYYAEEINNELKGIQSYKAALAIYDSIGYENGKTQIYSLLASAYYRLGLEKESTFYRMLAIEYYKKHERPIVEVAYFYKNIGKLLNDKQQYDSAKPFVLYAVNQFKASSNQWEIAQCHNHLAISYLGSKNYDSARYFAQAMIDSFPKHQSDNHVVNAYSRIIEAFLAEKNYRKAKDYLKILQNITDSLQKPLPQSINAYLWYRYYKEQQKQLLALKVLEDYVKYKERLKEESRQERLSKQQAAFDVINQQKTVELLQTDIALHQQEAKNSKILNIFLLVLGAVGVIAYFITIRHYKKAIYFDKLAREKQQQIEEQNCELEATLEVVRAKNEELYQANQQLQELNENNTYIIDMVAHDIRSPLARISGLLQILRMSNFVALDHENKKIFDKIWDNIEDLRAMTSRLLRSNALESGNIQLHPDKITPSSLLQYLKENWHRKAVEKNIQVSYTNETDPNFYFISDKGMICHALDNLMSNAVKHSPKEGYIEVRIRLTDENLVKISFTDNGQGISPQELPYLFKKYRKLSARPTGGENSTGLGLSIVKRITEILNAEVKCESTPGKGSTFYLLFPLKTQAKQEEELPISST